MAPPATTKLTLDLAPDLSLADEQIAHRLDFTAGTLTLWGYAPMATFDREIAYFGSDYQGDPQLPHLVAALDPAQARMLRYALDIYLGEHDGKAKRRQARAEAEAEEDDDPAAVPGEAG